MFEHVLPGNTKAVLALLEKSEAIQNSYLAGGTALALQLGHRISYDLDFFTTHEFDAKMVLSDIKNIADFQLEEISPGTILGRFSDVRFSMFYYEYPLLYATKKFGMINVVDSLDIAAMKIAAVASRGVKRDFVDLYFVCQEVATLEETVELYGKKYKNLAATSVHILKSLAYFEDAEEQDMPHMLKEVAWEEIKRFFVGEASRIAHKFIEGET